MRKLDVYYNEIKAGVLTEKHPGADYTFIYDPGYLSASWPQISATMPKRSEAYESESFFPFFANMIPEGANRRAICRAFSIDETDYFGLLAAMANKDFIGAINIRKSRND